MTRRPVLSGKIFNSIFLLLCFSVTGAAQVSAGGSFSLEKAVVPAGGGESAGGAFTIAGSAGQNAAGASTQNSGYFQIGGFWTADQLAPTAARVSVGGKVTTASGNGIRNVTVRLTDSEGNVRTTVTGSFGFYNFSDVEVGRIYVLEVKAKRYAFADPIRVLAVSEALSDIDFTAQE